MDILKLYNSGRRSIRLGRRYVETGNDGFMPTESSMSRWKLLWRRIKKEKKRFLFFSGPTPVPYDPYTYSQNFDQGLVWDEPENLSRAFSVRFADPSRSFGKNKFVVVDARNEKETLYVNIF